MLLDESQVERERMPNVRRAKRSCNFLSSRHYGMDQTMTRFYILHTLFDISEMFLTSVDKHEVGFACTGCIRHLTPPLYTNLTRRQMDFGPSPPRRSHSVILRHLDYHMQKAIRCHGQTSSTYQLPLAQRTHNAPSTINEDIGRVHKASSGRGEHDGRTGNLFGRANASSH